MLLRCLGTGIASQQHKILSQRAILQNCLGNGLYSKTLNIDQGAFGSALPTLLQPANHTACNRRKGNGPDAVLTGREVVGREDANRVAGSAPVGIEQFPVHQVAQLVEVALEAHGESQGTAVLGEVSEWVVRCVVEALLGIHCDLEEVAESEDWTEGISLRMIATPWLFVHHATILREHSIVSHLFRPFPRRLDGRVVLKCGASIWHVPDLGVGSNPTQGRVKGSVTLVPEI